MTTLHQHNVDMRHCSRCQYYTLDMSPNDLFGIFGLMMPVIHGEGQQHTLGSTEGEYFGCFRVQYRVTD